MAKLTDLRGKPGDIVLTRGTQAITAWRTIVTTDGIASTRVLADRAGTVMPGSLGLIVAVYSSAWTYVLWSTPCVCGWVHDGELRVVKVKKP